METKEIEKIKEFDIESNILRIEASGRGGGIEINVSELFGDNTKISAYQNYLGGGILGSVESSINFIPKEKDIKKVEKLQERLKKYYFNITNHENEWEQQNYKGNQNMPVSAY